MRETKSHPSEIIIQNAHAHNLSIDEIRFPFRRHSCHHWAKWFRKVNSLSEIIHREAQHRT